MLDLLAALEMPDINFSLSLKNFKTGYTYNYNETVQIPSASTIKLPIMSMVMYEASRGMLSLSDRLTIQSSDHVPFSIITLLDSSNTYTIKDLVTLMIIQSDNTATNILIDLLGINNINEYISSLGLFSTSLGRKMMDFQARELGIDNYTTSLDMARLLDMLYKGELVNAEYSSIMIDIMKQQLDRTMLYYDIPDEVVTAHKTGELHNINHDVGIFYGDMGDYIFSMLTWDAVNNNYARKTISKAAKLVYDYFNMGDKL